MAQDYNQTLNLPKTEFPMRAGLPQQEPKMLEKWENERLYDKMVKHTEGKPSFVLHDGPPYANATIHLGTALNKVLKDIIVRYKNMNGFHAPYVPGWDTHGLPIELKAIKAYGLELTNDPLELRERCGEFALSHVDVQKGQFKRLGTLADYDNPYLTLQPDFEGRQISVFGEMAQKGYIYKDLKCVHWCPECVTALAEAEIEYEDDVNDSLYVKFNVTEDKNGVLAKMGVEDLSKTFMLIWTTTTWTVPANQAICVGPNFDYVAVKVNGENYILAEELVASTMETAGITDYEILGSAKGSELEYLQYQHPFLDRVSPVILGDHVTLESGTGCVHTAPGHGADDFEALVNHYKHLNIKIVVPVDDHGKMTAEAGEGLEGLTTMQANKVIMKNLQESGHLFSVKRISHQYPHCWRCHEPILFRATEQWFCSVEDFKEQTLAEVEKVEFIPEWGKIRMTNMVRDRNAWCISRQRSWGVPIPAFYCDDCGKYIITEDTIKAVSDRFSKEGSNSWFKHDAKELLPEGFACPHCGSSHGFTKETDTMDVWFDSGCSHVSVLGVRDGLSRPADLYLEGADQFRGWFQSSLLTSVATEGKAPYKAICSNGWVVDGEGRKQSKSLGNGVAPEDIVEKYGADILRLWVASSDYHADIRVSDKILQQLSESYRKIRNTARYMLGNLSDFNPNTDNVTSSDLTELDRWALSRLHALVARCKDAYDKYDFHVVIYNVLNFCTIDMSNFYLDIIKDRLYVEKADSVARRAAQTAMYEILHTLTLLIAPVLSFTAEEIWQHMVHKNEANTEYAVLNVIPTAGTVETDEFMARWDQFVIIRNAVNKALEEARASKTIGKSLEATVTLHCSAEWKDLLEKETELLKTIFIVSDVQFVDFDNTIPTEIENLAVSVAPATGGKCERCWTISTTVGEHTEHPTLCGRCAEIIG